MKIWPAWFLLVSLAILTACADNKKGIAPLTCEAHSECPGEQLCIDNTCQEIRCEGDPDCNQGQLCLSNGRCAYAECRTNSDCCGPSEPQCGKECIDTTCYCADCSAGQAVICFHGCHKGHKVCRNGCWAPCDAVPVLPTETCDDAIDNDCNGLIDDGCSCSPHATRPCDSPCGQGVQSCETDGTWGLCDGDCCEPGDTAEEPCGNCGFRQGTCNASGQMQWSDTCEGEGICAVDAQDEQDCGNCGQQVRICQGDCSWGDWSGCTDQGECEPLATQVEACGSCGTWEMACNEDCEWQPTTTCDEGSVCTPAVSTQTRDCAKCGHETRDCVDVCSWGDWSDCQDQGVCEPGEITSEPCGNCGYCNKVCGDDCAWGPCSLCFDEGECPAATQESQACGPATDLGICEYGTQRRTCSPTCTWGSWDTCENAVYPDLWDACGNGIDEDCDGADYLVEDDYEPNQTCGTCTWLSDDPELTLYPTVDSPDDTHDYFCFNGIDNLTIFGDEEIHVTVTNQPEDMDVDIYLYASVADCLDRNWLAADVSLGNEDEEILWSEDSGDNDGIYYIEVKNWGDANCWLSYTLFIKGLR